MCTGPAPLGVEVYPDGTIEESGQTSQQMVVVFFGAHTQRTGLVLLQALLVSHLYSVYDRIACSRLVHWYCHRIGPHPRHVLFPELHQLLGELWIDVVYRDRHHKVKVECLAW